MKKIKEIRDELDQAQGAELLSLLDAYEEDERAGVAGLILRYRKKLQKFEEEQQRLEQMRAYEKQYAYAGRICGIDEAGRGPLAGPVAAAAVILPSDCQILYLNDSKKLSEKKREELYQEITEKAVAWGVGLVSPARIDEINILQATYEAMRLALKKLDPGPDLLLNDARGQFREFLFHRCLSSRGMPKASPLLRPSILAKVTRDRLMQEYDRIMPEYGFASHKGYGSAAHLEAIRKYGPSPIHRRSFLTHILEGDADEQAQAGDRI